MNFLSQMMKTRDILANRKIVKQDTIDGYLVSTIEIPPRLMPTFEDDPGANVTHLAGQTSGVVVFETAVLKDEETLGDSLFIFHSLTEKSALELHRQVVKLVEEVVINKGVLE